MLYFHVLHKCSVFPSTMFGQGILVPQCIIPITDSTNKTSQLGLITSNEKTLGISCKSLLFLFHWHKHHLFDWLNGLRVHFDAVDFCGHFPMWRGRISEIRRGPWQNVPEIGTGTPQRTTPPCRRSTNFICIEAISRTGRYTERSTRLVLCAFLRLECVRWWRRKTHS